MLIPIVENAISAARDAPRRHPAQPQGPDGRDRQHRRRGAARSSPTRWRSPTRRRRTSLFDFATLTGAARVALGPDLPPFYTDDEALAAEIALTPRRASRSAVAPAAVAPLRRRCSRARSPISTIAGSGGFAGSVTAALFLARFVVGGQGLGAFRHLRLEPQAARPRAAGRRSAGGARRVRAAGGALPALTFRPASRRRALSSAPARRSAPTTSASRARGGDEPVARVGPGGDAEAVGLRRAGRRRRRCVERLDQQADAVAAPILIDE